jgi:hypothetical protein
MVENILDAGSLSTLPEEGRVNIPVAPEVMPVMVPDVSMESMAPAVEESLEEPQQQLPVGQQDPPKKEKYKDYNDALNSLNVTAQRYFSSASQPWIDPKGVSQDLTKKYEGTQYGYVYGIDNDDFYGNQEGAFKTFGKGVGRLGVGVVSKVGEGVGFIGSLLNPMNWDSDIISNASDNAFSDLFNQLDEKSRTEWLPTYQEADDRDKGFWSRAFTDGDFWMTDTVDGLAFLVSAWVPGLALSKLSLGAKLARGLSGLRVGTSAAEAAIEGAGAAANYTKNAASAFNKLDKFNAWALATASESMFEAKEVKDRIMDSLSYDEFGRTRLKADGTPYTEDEKLRIAGAGAQNSFLFNAALLAATNAVELKWLGQALGKTSGVAGSVTGAAAFGESMGIRSATSGIERFLNSKKGAFVTGLGLGVGSEGFVEENAQLAIQRINETYGTAGRMADLSNTNEVFQQYFKQTKDALMGNDPEAATSIGLGGILGGIGSTVGSLRQFNRDQAATASAVEAYNAAQQSWLKFGNIYKTKIVESVDDQGNSIQVEKILYNENNEPIIDENKIGAIASSFRAVNSSVEESTKLDNGFKKDALRNTSFAQFVVAHINAGIEGTINQKLDAIKKSDPEQIAKLGFALDEDLDQQIDRYKGLTAAIIRQNELMNSDIIYDGSQDDVARKNKMVNIAAEQAAYKTILNDLLTETTSIKNEFMSSENSSLSDGIVDQLNELQYRIKSQEEVISDLKKKGFVTNLEVVARQILDNLKKNFDKLEKDNEVTVKTLEKDANGFYKYEKEERNQPGISENLNRKIKLKGELQNYIKGLGVEWALYADTKNGKRNFLKSLSDDMFTAVDAQMKEEASKVTTTTATSLKRPSKSISVTYKLPDDPETGTEVFGSTTFNVGDIYNFTEEETGKVSKLEIIDINEKDKSATIKLDEEESKIFDAEELAKLLDTGGWKKLEVKKGRKNALQEKLLETQAGNFFVVEENDTVTRFSEEGNRPRFDLIGFFKTFGRHYEDLDDTELVTTPGSDRFYKFTSKYNLYKQDYSLLVVTEANDTFRGSDGTIGIRQTDYNPNDIKVVVVKKIKEEDGTTRYQYINVNNEVIPEGEETKDNIIYRSLSDIKNWTVERIRGTKEKKGEYTADGLTDEDIQKVIDQHVEYQKSLVERSKEENVYLDIVHALPGVQRIEYVTAIDSNGKAKLSQAPVAGRVVVENPDFTDLRSANNPEANIRLRVSTGKGVIMAGVGSGRLVMQEYTVKGETRIDGDNIVRVFNRELTDQEKSNLFNLIVRLSELYNKIHRFDFFRGKKVESKATQEEKDEKSLIEAYLKGIINYNRPRQDQKKSNTFFYIKSGLWRGDTKISELTKKSILENKSKILKDLFHHVDNSYLNKNQEFSTLKIVKGKAQVDNSYDSYQEYLLAEREDGSVPPVYTSLPLFDSNIPQRSNVQLRWRDPSVVEPELILKSIAANEAKSTKEKGEPRIKGSSASIDNKIDDFLAGRINEFTLKMYKISYEVREGGTAIKIQKGRSKPSYSRPFASQNEIKENKSEILKNILIQTGYIYGASRGLTSGMEALENLKTATLKKAAAGTLAPNVSISAFDLIEGTAEEVDSEVDVLEEDAKKGFQGYKGGFENTGKGTPQGDGKDKAMRKVADAFIGETSSLNRLSSTLTSHKTLNKNKEASDENGVLAYNYEEYTAKVVMLARNGTLQGQPLQEETKQYIYEAFIDGVEFVVGDMPGVDSQFIDYLQEIGAKFTVYHTGDKSRITIDALEGTTNIKEEGPFYTVEEAVSNATPVNNKLSAVVSQMNVKTGEVIKLAEATVNVPSGNINAARSLLNKALISQLPTDSEEPPFRLTIDEMEATEDFDALSKFMKEKLPMFPVRKMGNLIHGKALGAFMRGGIYIFKNAGLGTGFHEAFEAVWASFLTQDEKFELASEFKSREGTFYNKFTKETKPYSEASLYDVREMLAEEFREYILLDNSIGNKIANFFKNLWKAIQGLFNLSTKDKTELNGNINKLFKKIKAGGFKSAVVIKDTRLSGPVYSSVGGLTQKDTTDILEGMNYYFFTELFKRGNNIDTILGSLDRKQSNELLNYLWNNAAEQVINNLTPISLKIKSIVETYKDDFYKQFKKNIDRYGVIFSELDQDEIDVTDTLGIRDSITIDPRSMTSTNVMLLLASLPQTTVSNGKITVVMNDLNQPRLVNTDRVHTALLNELSNVVSVVDKDGKRKNTLDLMLKKLDDKYKKKDNTYREGYGWVRNLKLRLKYENINGTRVPNSDLTEEDILLRVSFTKSFSNAKFSPEKLIISDEGYIYNANPLVNKNEDRIRNEWSNNFKIGIQNKQINLAKIDSSGRLIIDRSSSDYLELIEDLKTMSGNDKLPALVLNSLSKLGIEFSASLADLALYQQPLRENAMQILNLIKSGVIEDVVDIFGKNVIGGRINKLISIETEFNSEENILSYNNAEGQQQFSVGQPSLLSTTINILNTVQSLEELVRTAPWLGTINEETGKAELYPYQANSELLKRGGKIFNNEGKRKTENTQLSYHVISGLGVTEAEGANTAKLQFPDRVANKIHYMLFAGTPSLEKHIVFSNINSDKSTEYGIGIPGKLMVTKTDVDNFLSGNTKKVLDMYMNHLNDELDSAVVQSIDPVNIQYYRDNVYNLGHFRDIIGLDLIAKFKADVIDGSLETDEFIDQNKKAIEDKIVGYINKTIDETASFLKDQDIFVRPSAFTTKRYISDAIDNERLDEMLGITDKQTISYNTLGYYSEPISRSGYEESDIRKVAAILALNEEVLLTEQHKLIYGHPALYKDLPKRANGATSTKEALVEDSDIMEWMDDNMSRKDGKVRSEDLHQTFKNISFKDMDVVSAYYQDIAQSMYLEMIASGIEKTKSEKKIGATFNVEGKITGFILDKKGDFTGGIKAYMNLNEADAQAWGLPDMVRDLLFMSGKFTSQRKAQWNYQIAYETLVRSGSIPNAKGQTIKKNDPRYKAATEPEIQSARETYGKGDPGGQFEVLKPQNFGYAVTNKITQPVFLKHSLKPKFYKDVEGTQFEKLYIAAQKNQVDVINFESGQKVGNVTTANGKFLPIYNENGDINVQTVNNQFELASELPVQTLYSRFYGIQVEQSSILKKLVVKGTQVTKHVMSNFYENGKPVNNEVGDLITQYNNVLTKLMTIGKEELINEFGLERKDENDYEVKDVSKLVTLLRREAENRDLPDNIINAINFEINEDDTQSLQYDFDTLINRDKIDNILNAIADSRVISQKMRGNSSPQVASTLYESSPRNYVYLKDGVYKTLTKSELKGLTDEQRASIRMQSSDLKFYHSKDGKITAAEMYITWPFTEVTPEQIGLKLVNGIYMIPEGGMKGLDSELLIALGFRIPTQGMNSIESIIIKGFLPTSSGNMVVVPSEIVGKSGSDFDIDKLNIYLPNYFIDRKGDNIFIRYVKDNLDTKESLQNRLITIMSNLVLRPENYAQLIAPNTTDTLKELAEEVKKWKINAGTKLLEDEKSPTYLRTFIGSNTIRERYLTAKRMVGIAALHSTFHVMSQISGIKLGGIFNTSGIYYLTAKGEEIGSIDIKLDHHEKDKDGLFSIGYIRDKAGNFISDLISQALSGFVDGAKDPFVFDLNFSLNTANTWFYLQHLGVPVDQIAYFFNQPILDSFFTKNSKNRSVFKLVNGENFTKSELFYEVIAPYYNRLFNQDLLANLASAKRNDKIYNTNNEEVLTQIVLTRINEIRYGISKYQVSDLTKGIKDGSNADPKVQISVLMDYLEHETQGRLLSNFMQAISYDTNKTKTVQENMLQVSRWNRSEEERFVQNPEAILQNTFIGEMKKQKEDIFNMFKNFFTTLSVEVQEVFRPIYEKIDNPSFFITKTDAVNLVNRYQNFVLAYLLHTTSYLNSEGKEETLNNMYKDFFTGKNSFPSKLFKLKKSEDPNVSDNLIIKELVPVMTDDASKTDNIMLFRNKMDTFEINNVIEAYNDLRSYGEKTADEDIIKFADDLAKFSILQSGLQSSFIDYKKILSTEIYSELVKTILNRFKSNPAISTEQVWRNFHKNNWSNRSIVPKAPAWTKIENGVMKIGSSSSLLANDFMVKYILNPKYTREQLKAMKKNKSIVDAYQPILFEKTDEVDKKRRVIYVPIGKLGNGSRMLEIYDDERESILPGNVMQMETKAALTKAEGYTSAEELMKQPAYIKAKEEFKAEKSRNNVLKNLADGALKDKKTNANVQGVLNKKEEESKKCNKGQ